MKFRLLEGTHVEQTGWKLQDGRVVERLERGQEGEPVVRRWQVERDKKGNVTKQPVIETKNDLSAKFDLNPSFPPKFQRLPDDWVEPEPLVTDTTAAVQGLSPSEIVAFREYLKKQGNVTAVQQAAQAGFNPATSNTATLPSPVPQAGSRTVEAMSFVEIKKWAEEEEIDLKGAKSKEEALKALRVAGVLK